MGKKGGGKGRKGEERPKGTRRGKQPRKHLDRSQLASFAAVLRGDGYSLVEVERDGNCFFRSLADQLQANEHGHEAFRKAVCDHLEAHEDEFSPFMSFGESEEEEDEDYDAYVARSELLNVP
jgi:hypothetical protein